MARLAKHTWLVGLMAALLAFAGVAQCEELAQEFAGCEVHCVQAADQPGSALDEASPPVPALAFSAQPPSCEAPVRLEARTLQPRAAPPGPSLQILFCSFQT